MLMNHHHPADNPLDSATALIVDDAAVTRDLLARTLVAYGMNTLVAADGNEALKLLRDHYPDVIITDLEMPNIDGQELIEAIRHSDNEWIRSLPIIVCSSKTDELVRAELRYLGANSFIPKPIHVTEVLDKVELALTS